MIDKGEGDFKGQGRREGEKREREREKKKIINEEAKRTNVRARDIGTEGKEEES